jgi:transcriptional regulator with XRE-family HTH domain
MAEELGISQPAFANIESGKTKMNIDRIINISKNLNIDLHDLLDNNYTINNFNNKDNSTAIGNVENSILRQENSKLLSIIKKKN